MDKFAHMLHYFIWRGGDVPTLGKTVLHKLCYFSDLDLYELNECSITGTRYYKLPQGPAPGSFDPAMALLESRGLVKEMYDPDGGPHRRFRYFAAERPEKDVFSEDEIAMMDWEFERLGRMTAGALSEFSRKDVPWIIADDKGEISYQAVFYRDGATSVRDDEEP